MGTLYKSKYEKYLPHPRGSAEWKAMRIKPFTPNQLRALAMSNAPFNLWDGSIRAGKTFLSIAWLMNKNKELPAGNGMILGQTPETIERNLLNDLMEMLGESNFIYKKEKHIDIYYWVDIDGRVERKVRRWYIVGAKDKKAIGRIRGSTLIAAYIDEATLMPKEVFDELVGRLSSKEATMLATTNPDSPNHWLIKNYVENPKAKADWRRFKFLLDDNLALDPEYIERIKRQYAGIPSRYRRMILGEWVIAEGVIYSMFDEERHAKKTEDLPDISKARRLFVGSDYGVENPTAFLLMGEHIKPPERNPIYVVHKEYRYSGREAHRTKTTREFAVDFANFIKGHRLKEVVVDPSAAALITELEQKDIQRMAGSFYTVVKAKNDVLNGIQAVANLIQSDRLLVDDRCKHLIEEFELYVWDAKAQAQGMDKPVKSNDHMLDALRYAIFTLFREQAGILATNAS